jgi:hypothetical protein
MHVRSAFFSFPLHPARQTRRRGAGYESAVPAQPGTSAVDYKCRSPPHPTPLAPPPAARVQDTALMMMAWPSRKTLYRHYSCDKVSRGPNSRMFDAGGRNDRLAHALELGSKLHTCRWVSHRPADSGVSSMSMHGCMSL